MTRLDPPPPPPAWLLNVSNLVSLVSLVLLLLYLFERLECNKFVRLSLALQVAVLLLAVVAYWGHTA